MPRKGRSRIRLAAVSATLAIASLAMGGCEDKVNQANFNKLTNGMNKAQVENLLGKGEDATAAGVSISSSGVGDVGRAAESTMVWKGKSITITVVFKDGKVVQKSKTD